MHSLAPAINKLKVGQKIGLGYALALGIACGGTVSGILIGNTLAAKAHKDTVYAARKIHVLSVFQADLMSIQISGAHLQLTEENTQKSADQLQNIQLLSEEALVHWNTISMVVKEIEANPQLHVHRKLPSFYQAHNTYVLSYLNTMRGLTSSRTQPLADERQEILLLTKTNIEELELFLQDLGVLMIAADRIYQEAQSNAASANFFRNLIAITSLLISGVVSTLLALTISRSIIQPLKIAATTAQQVIDTEKFDVHLPAVTDDEIGDLTNALNQLIQWVGQYTHELEISGHTLEAKVESRTQELSGALQKLKDAQVQLIQTEKMSSLGQMVAGIAHEINNPITFIQGNLEPLKDYFQDLHDLLNMYQNAYHPPSTEILEQRKKIELDFLLEDVDKVLYSINMGTNRIKDIVVSLRNYSRLDEASVKEVDIHEGLDSTLLILGHLFRHDIEVIKRYGQLPCIQCSPAQLNQVFTNIIANALESMLNSNCHPKQLTITTLMTPAQGVRISIRDSGPGMSPDIQAKIFDPFFTTKPVGKGIGLGLGICLKIIQQHQGTIEVKAAPGSGTEFIIDLPQHINDSTESMLTNIKG